MKHAIVFSPDAGYAASIQAPDNTYLPITALAVASNEASLTPLLDAINAVRSVSGILQGNGNAVYAVMITVTDVTAPGDELTQVDAIFAPTP